MYIYTYIHIYIYTYIYNSSKFLSIIFKCKVISLVNKKLLKENKNNILNVNELKYF